TGEPPFSGPNPRATIALRFQGPPTSIRKLRPEVPVALADAVEKSLALEPAERFASARDFDSALDLVEQHWNASVRLPSIRRRFALVAGPLILTAVALLAARPHLGHRRLNPRRIAVAGLSNETGDSTADPLGRMVKSWIMDRLSRTAGVTVVTSAIVVPARHDEHLAASDVDDPERLHQLAEETRAGTLISG